jgi:hypothetical protein
MLSAFTQMLDRMVTAEGFRGTGTDDDQGNVSVFRFLDPNPVEGK